MIKIMADSTCDLSLEIIAKYDIGIAPLTIQIEGIIHRDKIDIDPDTFYSILENLREEPSTSMPSPAEYTKIFNEAIQDGYTEILCICMSSGTSAAYQSAVIARELFLEENPQITVPIYIVDSKSMSHGSGWLILKSCRLREDGASFEDLIAFNEKYKTRVKHFLSVDDLNRLIKSGRISSLGGFFGKLLHIKPIMTMKNGRGAVVAKERGQKKVIAHYVREFIKRNNPELNDFIIIGYTSDIRIAEELEYKLVNEGTFKGDIYIMQMGVAVGTHVGLRGISMFFMEKNKTDHRLWGV
ncbi:MAG: DegV family protein [Syntrophomonas sp.]|nr:DegV family protein [Syntrophomonas sp.]